MDHNMVEALAAVGSLFGLVCGGLLTWLLFNERRLSRLEKGQETTDETVKAGIERIDSAIQALQSRLDTYFANNRT